MALFRAKFVPGFSFCNARIDGLTHDGRADAARCLDLFTGIVEAVADDGLGAIFVGGDGLGGEAGGFVKVFVVCPVAAIGVSAYKSLRDEARRLLC